MVTANPAPKKLSKKAIDDSLEEVMSSTRGATESFEVCRRAILQIVRGVSPFDFNIHSNFKPVADIHFGGLNENSFLQINISSLKN